MKPRGLVVAVVVCASCRGGETMGSALAQEATGCEQAAEIEFDLRAAVGDYTREEGKKRAQTTQDDFKKSCAPEAKTTDCCAAALRLKDRLAGNKVANCKDLFARLASTGCAIAN